MTDEERRERQRIRSRRSYERNREKVNARSRAWAAANPEKVKLKKQRYRASEKGQETERLYAQAHREQNKLAAQRYREKNPEKVRLQWQASWERLTTLDPERNRKKMALYRERHPDNARHHIRKYRARVLGAEGSHTPQQLADRFAFYGNRCAYCGAEGTLQADHVIPLARGGANWASNIRPACRSCNARKNDRTPSEWRAA